MRLSVVIPAHNEETTVDRMVKLLFTHFGSRIEEVVIVNDCSTDETAKRLEQLKKRYKKLRLIHRKVDGGVGNAIRAGLSAVSKRASHVLMLDCDFLENIADIKKLLAHKPMDGLIGSRFITNGRLQNYPLMKKVANRSFHFLTKVILHIPHIDVTNNFKLYKREVVEAMKPYLSSKGFSINAETGMYPHLLGFRTKEIPVSWIGRKEDMGSSSFNIMKAGPGYARVLCDTILFKYFGIKKHMHKHRADEERKHFDMLIETTGETYYGNLRPVAKVRFQRKAQEVVQLLLKKKNPKVLEYGCGTGILARYILEKRPELAIEGIDVSPKAIDVAKKTLKKYKNARFRVADGLHLPYEDNSFDFVIGNSILHHIDLPEALAEIRRVLKPNGTIWFCEPNALNPQIAAEKNIPFLRSFFQDSEDERAFSRWAIVRDLQKHGYHKIQATPYEFLHPLLPGPLLPILVPFCIALEKIPFVNEVAGTMQIVAVNAKRPTRSRATR